MESICNGEKSPFKRVCTYHIRHESLCISDLSYEPKHDGSIVEELIFERYSPRPANLVETQSLIIKRRRLHSRLKNLHIQRSLANVESSDSNSNVYDKIQKQIERTGKTLSRTMGDLNRRLNDVSGLSYVRTRGRGGYGFHDESETLISRYFEDVVDQHISGVRNWFEKSLIILGTKDFYIPDDDTENLTRVINSMGIGIDSLVWDRYNSKYDVVYELDLRDWCEVNSHWENSHYYEGPIVTKTKNGIFRFTRDDNKSEIWMLSPVHNNNKRSLYSESDGTVRLIELASILISTADDLIFVVDELDRRLHPALSYRFIEMFRKDNSPSKQLIFTTHETGVLTTDLFRKDEIWFVEKEGGGSRLVSLDTRRINFNERLETMYLERRKLPGIPKINDEAEL